jgi:hypothetical protein
MFCVENFWIRGHKVPNIDRNRQMCMGETLSIAHFGQPVRGQFCINKIANNNNVYLEKSFNLKKELERLDNFQQSYNHLKFSLNFSIAYGKHLVIQNDQNKMEISD